MGKIVNQIILFACLLILSLSPVAAGNINARSLDVNFDPGDTVAADQPVATGPLLADFAKVNNAGQQHLRIKVGPFPFWRPHFISAYDNLVFKSGSVTNIGWQSDDFDATVAFSPTLLRGIAVGKTVAGAPQLIAVDLSQNSITTLAGPTTITGLSPAFNIRVTYDSQAGVFRVFALNGAGQLGFAVISTAGAVLQNFLPVNTGGAQMNRFDVPDVTDSGINAVPILWANDGLQILGSQAIAGNTFIGAPATVDSGRTFADVDLTAVASSLTEVFGAAADTASTEVYKFNPQTGVIAASHSQSGTAITSVALYVAYEATVVREDSGTTQTYVVQINEPTVTATSPVATTNDFSIGGGFNNLGGITGFSGRDGGGYTPSGSGGVGGGGGANPGGGGVAGVGPMPAGNKGGGGAPNDPKPGGGGQPNIVLWPIWPPFGHPLPGPNWAYPPGEIFSPYDFVDLYSTACLTFRAGGRAQISTLLGVPNTDTIGVNDAPLSTAAQSTTPVLGAVNIVEWHESMAGAATFTFDKADVVPGTQTSRGVFRTVSKGSLVPATWGLFAATPDGTHSIYFYEDATLRAVGLVETAESGDIEIVTEPSAPIVLYVYDADGNVLYDSSVDTPQIVTGASYIILDFTSYGSGEGRYAQITPAAGVQYYFDDATYTNTAGGRFTVDLHNKEGINPVCGMRLISVQPANKFIHLLGMTEDDSGIATQYPTEQFLNVAQYELDNPFGAFYEKDVDSTVITPEFIASTGFDMSLEPLSATPEFSTWTLLLAVFVVGGFLVFVVRKKR